MPTVFRSARPDVDAGRQPLIAARRTDIEGLRALAVGVVLLYHAGVPGFEGGYVGVDVFFALSGFLMTGLLATEHQRTGTVSFRAFYARRSRRLLPAAVLVLVVTAVAARVVLAPLAFQRAARDIGAAGLYVVNLRFAGQATNYLGANVDDSPILHYWSLAVEEQFYVVWPLLLWVALRRSASSTRPAVVLAVISAVSFALAVRLTADVQPWAFFGLHTRAWEFGLGGLGLFAMSAAGRVTSGIMAGVGWAGLLTIGIAVTTYGESTRFPGPGALLPVAGTVAVLLAGSAPGGPISVLSLQPLQWIGGRSYAMYLWHWPPIVLVPIALGRSTTVVENVSLIVAACGIAVVAHRFVEMPIRFSGWLGARPIRSGALAVGLTAAAVVVPWSLVGNDHAADGPTATTPASRSAVHDHLGAVPVPSNMRPSLDGAAADRPGPLYSECHVNQRSTKPALPCVFGDPEADRTMVLFGDSHMAQWFPMFEAVGIESGWRVVSLTKSACPSVSVSVFNVNFGREYHECDEWRSATLGVIADIQPDLVVLGNYPLRSRRQGSADDGPSFDADWLAGLRTTIVAARSSEARVLVMGPTPLPPEPIPDCVSDHLDDTRPCDLVREQAVFGRRIASERSVATDAGAGYLDVTDWFCGVATCPVVLGSFLVYRDASHVSSPYSAWLAERLEDVVERDVLSVWPSER
jgi:peptidoglycan/LPS O-acetylase OafA/YrhL